MQNINIISNLKDKLEYHSRNHDHTLKTKNNFHSDKYFISNKCQKSIIVTPSVIFISTIKYKVTAA